MIDARHQQFIDQLKFPFSPDLSDHFLSAVPSINCPNLADLIAGWRDLHPRSKDQGFIDLVSLRPTKDLRFHVPDEIHIHFSPTGPLSVEIEGEFLADRQKVSVGTAELGNPPSRGLNRRQISAVDSDVAALIAGVSPVSVMGDNLYIKGLDLSEENLPPGTRLQIGSAICEVSQALHLPCEKFTERFGADAFRFSSDEISELKGHRIRGVMLTVVQFGVAVIGAEVRKLP